MSTSTLHLNSNHNPSRRTACRGVATFISLCLLVFFGVAEAGACLADAAAVPLTAGESWTEPGAESACLVVNVTDRGLLAVELMQPADAPRVYLSLTGSDSAGFKTVRRSGQLLLLDAAPGRYGFSVSTVDGEHAAFRLDTRTVSKALGKDEHDGEIELEPEFLMAPSKVPADLASIPELSTDRRTELCRTGDVSTAAKGSLLCAIAVPSTAEAHGEMGMTWENETHIYRFGVATVSPVAIRTLATDSRGGELSVELLDRFGQRLGSWLTDGADRDSRTGRVLVPGTYFVRIQSAYGDPAGYRLTIESPTFGDAAAR